MTSPSRPLNIGSPRPERPGSAQGLAATASGSGSPNWSALRAKYAGTPPVIPNIPSRNSAAGTPLVQRVQLSATPRASTPMLAPPGTSPLPSALGGLSANRPASIISGSAPNLDELPDEEKAKVLRRHLVSREERERASAEGTATPGAGGSGSGANSRRGSTALAQRPSGVFRREDTEAFPVPYDAPGADITHNLYKWQAEQRRQGRPRAASFAGSTTSRHPAFAHIHEPGGFRRNYVLQQAERDGTEGRPIMRNFVEFLYIYGHFAGEDLEEIEEEDEEYTPFTDEDLERAEYISPTPGYSPEAGLLEQPSGQPKPDETTPLVGGSQTITRSARKSSRRKRSASVAHGGDASVTQAVLILLKGFVGTGILFLGKAFMNGGILFSAGLLSFIALISLYSFLLLVRAKFVVSGSFGDIGGALYGPWMRYAILTSIVVSQIGFVSAYTIFVAENLQSFVAAITNCLSILPLKYFILIQMIVLLPLALVRNIAKLSTAALIADVFIVAGLIYIFGSEAAIMSKNGPGKVELFNPKDFPLMVGTAIFSFEGIGLVIPVTDAMREPHKFPKVLTGVMISLMFLFGGGGVMSYLTFGSEVKTVVLLNLPDSKTLQVVQFLYSAAILLSIPLQLFPAVRIMETGLFQRSGKGDSRVKWQKNFFRFCIVMLCAVISYVGAADLDKFVAFIGSFACIPLCYVYPPMLHLRACAHTRRAKLLDYTLIAFGLLAAVYNSVQTLSLMLEPAPAGDGMIGRCEAPPPTLW